MYLEKLQYDVDDKIDTQCGVHYIPILESWRMNNKSIIFKPDDINIYIDDNKFESIDLYDLIFMKNPPIDMQKISCIKETYKKILITINAHLRNYNPVNPIQSIIRCCIYDETSY